MSRMGLMIVLLSAVLTSTGTGFAADKKPKAHAKLRALLFNASDAKIRPTFDFETKAPEKVSAAPILFTTVTGEKVEGSDEPDDVSITAKKLMLDPGKTESAPKAKAKQAAKP